MKDRCKACAVEVVDGTGGGARAWSAWLWRRPASRARAVVKSATRGAFP